MALKLPKFSPIDREYPVYELIDENNDVLLDVSRSNEGVYEIALHEGSVGRVLPLDDVLLLIQRARALLENET